MKVLPEGLNALLAPAAMLPASLLRPDVLPVVPTRFEPLSGAWAAKDSWTEVAAINPAKIIVMMDFRIVISFLLAVINIVIPGTFHN
jgi:hypothetical protein